MDAIFIYTTLPVQDAARIAHELVERGLAGCANILEGRSVYRWEGKIHDEREATLLLKTTVDGADALIGALAALHPYEVPCIARLPVDVQPAYGAWLARK